MVKKKVRKPKTEIYGSNKKVIARCYDLPDGYFYKGTFYTSVTKLFNLLCKEGVAGSQSFPNGIWYFRETCYSSLRDAYEYNLDYGYGIDDVSYQTVKQHYLDFGIEHTDKTGIMYWATADDNNELFNTKDEAINNYEWESYWWLICGEETAEEQYFDSLTDTELIAYCKKSIKERIKCIENWLKETYHYE